MLKIPQGHLHATVYTQGSEETAHTYRLGDALDSISRGGERSGKVTFVETSGRKLHAAHGARWRLDHVVTPGKVPTSTAVAKDVSTGGYSSVVLSGWSRIGEIGGRGAKRHVLVADVAAKLETIEAAWVLRQGLLEDRPKGFRDGFLVVSHCGCCMPDTSVDEMQWVEVRLLDTESSDESCCEEVGEGGRSIFI